MDIKGTFHDGKMFRGNGRWVKIMETRFTGRPSMISIAFGDDAVYAYKAKTSCTFDTKPGYRKSLVDSAKYYIETGEIDI